MPSTVTTCDKSKEKVFSMWALNDVATALFIQGEAYRRAGMMDEAKAAFNKKNIMSKDFCIRFMISQ